MGVDFEHTGISSYPTFDRQLCEIAEIFGGIKTEYLKKREETENERPCGYWFGFISSDNSEIPRFVFPEGTNDVLIKWFNNIYGDFNKEETEIIWRHISEHPEIKEISSQIWNELEKLVYNKEEWYVY